MVKHPLQPLYCDGDGTIRFKPNSIVKALLDTGKLTMNDLAVLNFPDEDREQFAQLIGYSVDGFGELRYVSGETWKEVQDQIKPKSIDELHWCKDCKQKTWRHYGPSDHAASCTCGAHCTNPDCPSNAKEPAVVKR